MTTVWRRHNIENWKHRALFNIEFRSTVFTGDRHSIPWRHSNCGRYRRAMFKATVGTLVFNSEGQLFMFSNLCEWQPLLWRTLEQYRAHCHEDNWTTKYNDHCINITRVLRYLYVPSNHAARTKWAYTDSLTTPQRDCGAPCRSNHKTFQSLRIPVINNRQNRIKYYIFGLLSNFKLYKTGKPRQYNAQWVDK